VAPARRGNAGAPGPRSRAHGGTRVMRAHLVAVERGDVRDRLAG